ncbi:hypothetical protein Dvar_51120 [Desulfosarcina variabilis str. Montpellier]|uniref:DUF4007 family protein n=1 Tax=Desulfosarcina variabilis TaxID=2300 RepID=UPI003AFB4731
MADKGKTGHRQRLRDRFLSGDEESSSDEALLELLLTYAIGRKDVQPIAEELLRVFGNLDEVLGASGDNLKKIKGLGQASIALLKAIDCIKTRKIAPETARPLKTGGDAGQMQLFEDPPSTPKLSPQNSLSSRPLKIKTQPVTEGQPSIERQNSPEHEERGHESKAKRTVKIPGKSSSEKKGIRRKLQVSNSYLLEFDQLARVLNFLLEQKESKRIKRKLLKEETGLADRQVEGLVSMGTAMGLIKPNVQILTPTGLIIATHDIFIESSATLEWCHYKAAGSYQNLIWFDVFNHLLSEQTAMTQEGWEEYFRNKLRGQYTKKTLKVHVHKEIRFVIDAYTERNFKKLELLQKSDDERIYRRRFLKFNPLVLTAMIYDFCALNELQLAQISEMAAAPGSPAMVFGLDVASFRQQIEGLHDRGWLRYETTHNLDQIRLKPGLSAISFLSARFEDHEPREDTKQSPGGIFQ